MINSLQKDSLLMKNEWVIKYWPPDRTSSIERWFKKLTKEQQTEVTTLLEILKENGNEIKLPHSRPLGKKLHELREGRFGYRVYYMFYKGNIVVLLAAGDKSTQERDIEIARVRVNEVLKRGKELL